MDIKKKKVILRISSAAACLFTGMFIGTSFPNFFPLCACSEKPLSADITKTYCKEDFENNSFFSMLSRMKNISRWSLLKNIETENLKEHSLDTAVLAHALAVIRNQRFGGDVDVERAAVMGMFHDATEIITGDMPTPVKYYKPEMKEIYNKIDEQAKSELLDLLPDNMKDVYSPLLSHSENESELWKIVKAADTLSALIKCLREKSLGNTDFDKAQAGIINRLHSMNMSEVEYFIDEFLPSFGYKYE